MKSIDKTIEEFKAWAANRPKLPQQQTQEPAKPAQVQLPIWPEAVRAVPNGFLRSALFGAIRKGRRRYMQGEQIAAVNDIEIKYTGQQLDQGDLDVWESVLHAVRLQSLGNKCRVTSYQILKALGKTDTGKNRVVLQTRIERLRATAVTIKQGRYSYIGGLIDEAYKDEETQQWVIVLNPKLRTLFAADSFTQIEWSIRRDLDGHQLAQWLHGFYASHAQPYPVKIETLHRLCGSEAVVMSDFAKKLRAALDDVARACAAHNEHFSYAIHDDIVYVEKTPSASQRRHLVNKTRKRRD